MNLHNIKDEEKGSNNADTYYWNIRINSTAKRLVFTHALYFWTLRISLWFKEHNIMSKYWVSD